ncbi:MAG: porin [Bacteroidia bacterium]|nr:MAG: porin [Bacteroidia bacterium]
MKNVQQFMMLCVLICLTAFAYGQSRTVTGLVTSSLDGEPIAEASVRLKGAITVVSTDATGRYSIEVPENSSLVLIFTHEDHDPKELVIGGRTVVNAELVHSVRFNQYGRRVNRTPLTAEERDGILIFESADQDYKMWFDLRVQADGAAFFGDTWNDIGNGVAMRRVRVAFKAELTDKWEAEFDMDFADALADLKDAFLIYRASPRLDIKAGNFKERFSMEQNTSSRWLTFMERPAALRTIAPSRHLGLQFHYHRPYFVGVGGLHFQDVGDYEAVQNRKDNNAGLGINEGYSLTGKLTFIPFWHEIDRGLHFGVAGSYRTPKTHDSAINSVRFDSRSNSNINRKKYLDTDRMLYTDNYQVYNFEVAGNYKGFRFATEYIMANVNRDVNPATGMDLDSEQFSGFYIMGSYLLFGGTQLYNNYQGEYTQPINGKPWGDVEIALRYDYSDFNNKNGSDDPADWGVMGGSGEGFTFAINYYAPKNVKLQVNYGYLNFDRYANQRGRLVTGLDQNGNPTRNPFLIDPAQSDREPGERFHWIGVRFQVAF